MRTVSTLCGTSALAGVSAVGLSFGRPDERCRRASTTAIPKSKQAPLADPNTTTPTATTTATTAHAPLVDADSLPPVSVQAPPLSSSALFRSYHDGRPPLRRRRMTSSDVPSHQQHSAAEAEGNLPSLTEDGIDPFSQRLPVPPPPYWTRRWSALSHNSSIPSSPRPESPTLSFSNASAAASHNGSIVPMIGSRPPPPSQPNKLVKRSASVKFPPGSSRPPGASKYPTFKRPATSHQRSATLQSSLSREGSFEIGSDWPLSGQLGTQGDDLEWCQYFTARIQKEKTSSKKRNSSGEVKTIKRIYPDSRHHPTLLVAGSVSPSPVETEESSGADDDSGYNISRPATPNGLDNSATTSKPTPPFQPNNSGKRAASTDKSRPSRSFSFTKLFALDPSTSGPRLPKPSGSKIQRKLTRRAFSSPLANTNRRPNSAGQSEAPSMKRDFSDPTSLRREIYSSPNDHIQVPSQQDENHPPERPRQPVSSYHPRTYSSSFDYPRLSNRIVSLQDTSDTSPPSSGRTSMSGSVRHIPVSPSLQFNRTRPPMAPSDRGSTLVESDNDTRGVPSGDEETDLQSDTLYDSMRTRATRSTSGPRGPRIETIFDESPPPTFGKAKVTALRDILPETSFKKPSMGKAEASTIIEENGSVSTPSQRKTSGSRASDLPVLAGQDNKSKSLNLGSLPWESSVEKDDSRWSFDDEEVESWDDEIESTAHTPVVARPLASLLRPSASPATPQHLSSEHSDRDARSSLFDWSEQPTNDRSPGNGEPPRPRTVHGKKDAERRVSRSIGRPTGLHARSQSVPVVPDADGNRQSIVTNKFGTWGVGSKGVTEDWDDDFDFNDSDTNNPLQAQNEASQPTKTSKTPDANASMFVPKSIREQQSNVLANIGLLREWGIVIEELKELRLRAATIGILHESRGHQAELWARVDAMIELADQEAEDEGITAYRSRSGSPPADFDIDPFEDPVTNVVIRARNSRHTSPSFGDELAEMVHPSSPHHNRKRRKSILPEVDDIFGTAKNGTSSAFVTPKHTPEKPSTPGSRPRKDSEAVARSVIEAFHHRKGSINMPAALQATSPSKKVPFDTATLKHIVPYVNGLMRRVKQIVREAEGLYSTPTNSPRRKEATTLPLNQLFQSPTNGSPSRKHKSVKSASTMVPNTDPFPAKENDVNMKLMPVM